ncbi:helix-turn-helix domain-containing protein [Streptomyces sp. SID161]|uniref:helix-turn-helix domain-containing protein n=1 Tax=Streptomyces sp. SID161 TaxID=2690251 RepID=UPI00136F1D6F|nr:helix-turn-helix domain-containing protein [Streptomyces sp. SID161]MYW49623.1 transcriptional regulator [Streptomyces sp. SID161]
MTAASQWLHTTTGRIATDPYSWMQAVHWIHGSGLYTSPHADGPRTTNETTLAIAQEISALKECRPGIAYLARRTKVSERSVKYHLRMLREAGLLAYRSKGTRISGVGGRASEFERTIPAAFDAALGIRTVGEGATRRPVGAAPESRTLLGKLAKKAARKTRRPRRRTPVSGRGRCTPMEGGTSTSSSAAGTYSPPESKLASGQEKSPTPKQTKRGPRTLNRVGRRYQLARELIQQVPWLKGAPVPRIAWIIRHVADAGWTVLEVQAAAERLVSDREPRRPSAVLAYRLSSCHLLYTTPDRRKVLVEDWQDSRRAEQARHQDAEYAGLGADRTPARVSVQSIVREAFRRTKEIATGGPVDDADCFHIPVETAPEPVALEALDRATVLEMRAAAAIDPGFIYSALETGMSERDARRLFTNWLVDQALAAQRTLTPAF